jgi:hypothetical protein
VAILTRQGSCAHQPVPWKGTNAEPRKWGDSGISIMNNIKQYIGLGVKINSVQFRAIP